MTEARGRSEWDRTSAILTTLVATSLGSSSEKKQLLAAVQRADPYRSSRKSERPRDRKPDRSGFAALKAMCVKTV